MNIVATTRPCPIPRSPARKAEQQRGGGERAQNRKIDGAACSSSIRRTNAAANSARIAVRVRFRRALFLSAMRSRRAIRIDRTPATAPSMKAGAVVCEIASLK